MLWEHALEVSAKEVPFTCWLEFDHAKLIGRAYTVSEELDCEAGVPSMSGKATNVEVSVRESDNHVVCSTGEDACVRVVICWDKLRFGNETLLMDKLFPRSLG